MNQFIDFLEAKPDSPPDHPAKAAAICMSANDFNDLKTSLEQLCRKLGNRCNYELKKAIQNMARMQ